MLEIARKWIEVVVEDQVVIKLSKLMGEFRFLLELELISDGFELAAIEVRSLDLAIKGDALNFHDFVGGELGSVY